ncbi:poxin-like isoform X2 [Plodia interpunctella]|uniref:poxin-like isoform X2 n=1 Tax=Plodia interpunctella TaxID=58824 RepID=UPI002367B7A7|nr:poxin-like isoform X2 [Plodia interpunctella]
MTTSLHFSSTEICALSVTDNRLNGRTPEAAPKFLQISYHKESKTMSRTVYNEQNKGLVESFSIPAEVHERDGKKFASFGSVLPIHCCTPEQVAERAKTTHHYCDVFTDEKLAPLGELAYVRIDDNTAEKVFINRSKKLLIVSSDGRMAQWRAAPSFESANQYLAGAPLVNQDGELVTVVTAKRGNHYAVSTFEGEGGYFETSESWKTIDIPEGNVAYGLRTFASREELREHVAGLTRAGEGAGAGEGRPLVPVLFRGRSPRIALVAAGGKQLAHMYLQHGIVADVEYL